ncbi:hypothetical protein DGWBC_1680 [Dehalogenimonas sp. WBC-2]|nr:hypothetical protein DGWBC_1680 [Dehalogenimonas sp. WBC-2]
MTRADFAYSAMMESKMNCAQAVLTSFAEELGLDKATALRLSQGFGGGMGRTGKTCGAVTGAFMVLGLIEQLEGREGIEAVYAKVKEFDREFVARHGSTECNVLLDCDICSTEGMERARSEGLFKKVCPGYVRSAVEILEDGLPVNPAAL